MSARLDALKAADAAGDQTNTLGFPRRRSVSGCKVRAILGKKRR